MDRDVDNTFNRAEQAAAPSAESSFDSSTAGPLIIDVETTTHSKGHPFNPLNKLVSYASLPGGFKYYTDPDFVSSAYDNISNSRMLVGFNIKFDLHWLNNIGCVIPDTCSIWDCQLAEFVLSGQKDVLISLNECLERYGLPTKTDEVKTLWEAGMQTTDIPVATLQEYNEWDVYTTKLLYQVQQQLLSEKQKALVLLLGEDLKVLSHIEQAGIKYDRVGAMEEGTRLIERVAAIRLQLVAHLPPAAVPYFNLDSGDDLSCFLYGGTRTYEYPIPEEAVYKSGEHKGTAYIRNRWHQEVVIFDKRFEPLEDTEVKKTKDKVGVTKLYQTDEPTLRQLKSRRKEDKEILALLGERSALSKVAEMLESIEKQFVTKGWEDSLMHGSYNQNIVVTGRLSSSAPNQQNMPEDVSKFLVSRYD